jgi:DNA modification methylase
MRHGEEQQANTAERRVRRKAKRDKLLLLRSRSRTPGNGDYGLYELLDESGQNLARGLTIQQAEEWLEKPPSKVAPLPFHYLTGHALDRLRKMPSDTFDCCVTSPPYWFQRDNQHKRQIGLERKVQRHIADLCDVFDELLRVMKPEGTLWLNLGDSYSTRRKIKDHRRDDQHSSWAEQSKRGLTINGALGLPQKNLLLLPERIVSTLQETGWTLRSRITWVKTHALFDRDEDRPRGITESVFLLTKRARGYHWRTVRDCETNVWTIPPAGGQDEHSARMPLELAVRCIECGCPPGGHVIDPFAGSGTTAVAALNTGRESTSVEINKRTAQAARARLQAWVREHGLSQETVQRAH